MTGSTFSSRSTPSVSPTRMADCLANTLPLARTWLKLWRGRSAVSSSSGPNLSSVALSKSQNNRERVEHLLTASTDSSSAMSRACISSRVAILERKSCCCLHPPTLSLYLTDSAHCLQRHSSSTFSSSNQRLLCLLGGRGARNRQAGLSLATLARGRAPDCRRVGLVQEVPVAVRVHADHGGPAEVRQLVFTRWPASSPTCRTRGAEASCSLCGSSPSTGAWRKLFALLCNFPSRTSRAASSTPPPRADGRGERHVQEVAHQLQPALARHCHFPVADHVRVEKLHSRFLRRS